MRLKSFLNILLTIGSSVFLLLVFMQQDVSAQMLTADNYNVIALNNLSLKSHIEGRAAVGNDFTAVGGNGEVGQHLTVSPTDRSLVVAGNILGSGASFKMMQGSIYHNASGTIQPTVSFNGGSGAGITTPGLTVSEVAALQITYQNASAYYQNTAANNTATNLGTNNPSFNATTANGNGQAIFLVSGASLGASQGGVSLTIGTGVSDVVINVSGTNVTLGNSLSFNLAAVRTNILWNFYEATNVTFNTNFAGAILAPYATVTLGSVSIDSKVIAYNVTGGDGEIHNIAYNGPPLETVPEPGVASLLGTAASFYLLRRRRS
jgi:choice-of-anchor A domain-containing protein